MVEMNTGNRRFRAVILATLLTSFLWGSMIGCAAKEEKQKRAPIRIALPKSPDLTRAAPAERLKDGSYTVWGALQIGDDTSDTEVRVVGHVVEVHLCDKEEEQYCGLPSHMLLTDDLKRSAYRLIVTGRVLRNLGTLDVGSKVQLSGMMRPMSADGRLVSLDGLLVLPSPEDEEAETVTTTKRKRKRARRKARIKLTKP